MSDHTRSREIGRRIAAARQAAGLTQRELAERMGWPRFSLINLELGRRGTTIDRLDAVAVALGVPPAVFLIDDSTLASVIKRLMQEPEAVADVQFFLDAREEAPPLGDDPVRQADA
jgi:transcriptional regulator with XRE-family HTH domain